MYDPQTARWLTQDPLAQKYYPHNIGQNPSGPFKEMHRDYHRGKNSYKTNHPAKSNKIDKKEFKKARNEYWRKEFYNK